MQTFKRSDRDFEVKIGGNEELLDDFDMRVGLLNAVDVNGLRW